MKLRNRTWLLQNQDKVSTQSTHTSIGKRHMPKALSFVAALALAAVGVTGGYKEKGYLADDDLLNTKDGIARTVKTPLPPLRKVLNPILENLDKTGDLAKARTDIENLNSISLIHLDPKALESLNKLILKANTDSSSENPELENEIREGIAEALETNPEEDINPPAAPGLVAAPQDKEEENFVAMDEGGPGADVSGVICTQEPYTCGPVQPYPMNFDSLDQAGYDVLIPTSAYWSGIVVKGSELLNARFIEQFHAFEGSQSTTIDATQLSQVVGVFPLSDFFAGASAAIRTPAGNMIHYHGLETVTMPNGHILPSLEKHGTGIQTYDGKEIYRMYIGLAQHTQAIASLVGQNETEDFVIAISGGSSPPSVGGICQVDAYMTEPAGAHPSKRLSVRAISEVNNSERLYYPGTLSGIFTYAMNIQENDPDEHAEVISSGDDLICMFSPIPNQETTIFFGNDLETWESIHVETFSGPERVIANIPGAAKYERRFVRIDTESLYSPTP